MTSRIAPSRTAVRDIVPPVSQVSTVRWPATLKRYSYTIGSGFPIPAGVTRQWSCALPGTCKQLLGRTLDLFP